VDSSSGFFCSGGCVVQIKGTTFTQAEAMAGIAARFERRDPHHRGGIGGVASALALARRGLRSRVLEKAPEFGEIGYGIQQGRTPTACSTGSA